MSVRSSLRLGARRALLRPSLQGDGEGLLQHVLGEVEVPQQANQRGEGARALLAEQGGEIGDRHQFGL